MQVNNHDIEDLIEKEFSISEFFQYLNEYTALEHKILSKLTRTDIKRDTGCSYYHIQKFCESKRLNLEAYFKLVKYARKQIAQLR